MMILERLTTKEEAKEKMPIEEITGIPVGDVYIVASDFISAGAELQKGEYIKIEKAHPYEPGEIDEYNVEVYVDAEAVKNHRVSHIWHIDGDAIRAYCIRYADPSKVIEHAPAKDIPFRRMQPDEFRRALAKHA